MSVNQRVEGAGRSASGWSLRQFGKLSTSDAQTSAKLVKVVCDDAVKFLENPGTERTAEAVNKYLVDYLLKNLNPLVASGIDTAAGVLDDILDVPAGKLLTTAELEVLAAFVKGIGEGAQDYLAGKASTEQPKAVTRTRAMRLWIHA
jgi:hypothetical protein